MLSLSSALFCDFSTIYSNNDDETKNFKISLKYTHNKFVFIFNYNKHGWANNFAEPHNFIDATDPKILSSYVIYTPDAFDNAIAFLTKEGCDSIKYITPFKKLLICDIYKKYVNDTIIFKIDQNYIFTYNC